jgi:carbon-monoxide dehydrogenase small subunit
MDTDFHDITLSVNGTQYRRRVESRVLLSDFILFDLVLAGTHVGCEPASAAPARCCSTASPCARA